MAKYTLFGKEVTKEEFDREVYKGIEGTIVINKPFFLDEVLTAYIDMSKTKSDNVFEGLRFRNEKLSQEEKDKVNQLRSSITGVFCNEPYDFKLPVTGASHHTGGTVFEKVQDYSSVGVDINFCKKDLTLSEEDNKKYFEKLNKNTDPLDAYNAITGHSTRHKTSKDLEEKVKGSQETYGTKIDLLEFPNDYLTYLVNMYNGDFNRPEKFTVEELPKFGKKETEGKLDYSEINFNLLDLMAKRFMDNKVKYPKGNTLKEIDQNEILWAAFRHIRKMIKPIEGDTESYKDHLAAVATNMSIILDQLERK